MSEKRLVYIVNHVHEGDTTHLFHVLNLLHTMRTRGWAVKLLSERGGGESRTVAGHEVTYLSNAGYASRAWRLFVQLVRLRREGYRLVFVRICKVSALVSILVGKCIGMRVLYWHSGANHDIDRKKPLAARFIDERIFALIKRGVDGFVSGPEAMLDYYANQYGVRRSKLKLLYNDVDIDRFRPGAQVSDQSAVCKILFVHRFSPIRRTAFYFQAIVDRLNTAAAAGFPSEITLIGDGPEQLLVEQSVRHASSDVVIRFLGARPNAELPQHYANADVFIMPSYREGFPRVVIEAMAAGLPVVSTNAGGTGDVVGPLQREFVVSRDDPEQFADRLEALVRDPALRARLRRENLAHVRRYATGEVAAMFEKLLLEHDRAQAA